MPMIFLDATARAAAAAATSQTAQIAGLAGVWAGDVAVRYYTSGGTLLRTCTHAAWVQSTVEGRRQMAPGAIAAESRFSTGTAAYAICAVPSGADILRCDVSLGAAVTDPGGRVNMGAGSGAAGLVVLADAGLSLTGLPAWMASAAVNEWIEIPNTALSSVAPSPTPVGSTGPSAKITSWCGACLKTEGSIYMLGAAGGHNDYSGNEVNALTLNTATPAWVQHCAPSASADQVLGQFYLDGKPSATHTYQMTQFINSQNRMVIFHGTGGYIGTPPLPSPPPEWDYQSNHRCISYAYGSAAWEDPDTITPLPPGFGDLTACLIATHPVTGDTYISDGNSGTGFYKWTAATNTVTEVSNASRAPWYVGSSLDYTRDRILYIGGANGGESPGVIGTDGVAVSVTFGGLGSSVLVQQAQQAYPGCVYDPELDSFWVFWSVMDSNGEPIAAARIYLVHAGTWVVSEPTLTGVTCGSRKNGIHNSVQYVPELKGLVYANSYTGNVLFMRTA